MTGKSVFEKDFQVHYYELDQGGRIDPVTILNYFQDAAACHAIELGVAVRDLMAGGLTWVLSRFHLLVERYPKGGETLRVRTWPSTREGHFTCREFQLFDNRGRVAALATSSWAVLDLATRRPVELNGRLPDYPLLHERAVADDFQTLPRLEEGGQELFFPVRRSDLDINRHVNNAVYAGWALDSVPDETVCCFVPVEMEIGYRAEAFAGDIVVSRCKAEPGNEEPCLIHQLLNKADGKELTRLRTRWRAMG